jgi:predicted ATP-binding protein involved in virulence
MKDASPHDRFRVAARAVALLVIALSLLSIALAAISSGEGFVGLMILVLFGVSLYLAHPSSENRFSVAARAMASLVTALLLLFIAFAAISSGEGWFGLLILVLSGVCLYHAFANFYAFVKPSRRTRDIEDAENLAPVSFEELAPSTRGRDKLPGTAPADVDTFDGTLRSSPKVSEARRVPMVPDELLAAFSTSSCVLFAGCGVAAQVGVPLGAEGWRRVLEEAMRREPSQNWDNLRRAYSTGETAALIDLLRARLSHETLVDICNQVFSSSPARPSKLNQLIADIPFAGVLSTAWDQALEHSLARRRPARLMASDSERFGSVLREKNFFLLKINGDASRPETVLFTPEDYRRTIYEREPFAKFLHSVVSSNVVLFAGASLATIENFFSGLRVPMNTRRHFALISGQANIDFESERFLSRYGIQLLAYDATPGHPELELFFNSLWTEMQSRPELLDAIRPEPVTLDRVILRNIGPFEEVNLEMGRSWNVLLGNNGCGKSNILRAIAVGLCGDEVAARGVAANLLRSGAEKGSIELWFGNQQCVTNLFRDGPKVTLKSDQLSPFRTGRWLVLGFPALRGVSQHRPLGPRDQAHLHNPDIKDIESLIDGVVDASMDNIKQWIINTYLLSEPADGVAKEQADHNKRLLNSFFGVLGELTPGVSCRFHSVDRMTWDVVVTTDDGHVSIDVLSQGTNSVFGWVGTLLQRLYEVYPNTSSPERQTALVLVDEIDAHMHPEWQQLVVPMMRKRFPELQVIATTHSPLIVGNMEAKEVYRLSRESSGRVTVRRVPETFAGFRADQILTSQAFNLETTVSIKGKELMDEYSQLLGTASRSHEQESRLRELSAQIESTIPRHGETAEQRETAELIDQLLVSELQNQPEERRRRILAASDSLLGRSAKGAGE